MNAAQLGLDAWEAAWAPYDESTYHQVCAAVTAQDTLLEIGAGDLRLARRLAGIARRVIAVELQGALLQRARGAAALPGNLFAVQADARSFPTPPGVTAAVLLMRHCTHFQQYAQNLKLAGVNRLITNARWGMGVEVIELQAPRQAYQQLPMGWYACWCGAAGFKPGSAEELTPALDTIQHEVLHCPRCQPRTAPHPGALPTWHSDLNTGVALYG
jgi:hypothetical protein